MQTEYAFPKHQKLYLCCQETCVVTFALWKAQYLRNHVRNFRLWNLTKVINIYLQENVIITCNVTKKYDASFYFKMKKDPETEVGPISER